MRTKLIALFALVAMPLAISAADVTLAWDASPDAGVKYILKDWNFTTDPVSKVRTRTTVKTTFPTVAALEQKVAVPIGEHLFTAQALHEATGLESLPSNEVFHVVLPAPPGNMRIKQTPVASGMRLDITGDRVKRLALYRNNGSGNWVKIHTFNNFKGEEKYVDKNWGKNKAFQWKVEIEKA